MKFTSTSEAVSKTIANLKKRESGIKLGYDTGFKNLNNQLGGELPFGFNLIIGSRSGGGKSTLANILMTNLFEYNKDVKFIVFYWNFEMSVEEQIRKLVSNKIGFTTNEIKSLVAPKKLIKEALDKITTYNIRFINTSKTIDQIEEYNRSFIAQCAEEGTEIKVVNILDYITLVEDRGLKSDKSEIDATLQCFLRLKQEFECTNILISQLNRDIEKLVRTSSTYPLPHMADLMGSSSIENTANMVLIPFRPAQSNFDSIEIGGEEIDTKDRFFIQVAKNREGPLGTLMYHDCLHINKIEEIEEQPLFNVSNNKELEI